MAHTMLNLPRQEGMGLLVRRGRAHTPWFLLHADLQIPKDVLPPGPLMETHTGQKPSCSLDLSLASLPCKHGPVCTQRLLCPYVAASPRDAVLILSRRLLLSTTINKLPGKGTFTSQGLSSATPVQAGRNRAAALPFSKSGHGEGRELASHV